MLSRWPFFYAIGTVAGGISGPFLFGALVNTGKESAVYVGYIIGAALMIAAGVIQAFMGVDAEQEQLEDIAEPITAVDEEATKTGAGKREPQPAYSWRYSSGSRARYRA